MLVLNMLDIHLQDSELNGLSLFGWSGTTLEYIQVYKCTDDGFEWFKISKC